nr:calcium-activated chloride channel regulator 4A-like [Lytechinus pictus]
MASNKQNLAFVDSMLTIDIDTFCDIKADDEGRLHNKMAHNLQNRNCDGQSVWEVIRKSDDWKEYGIRPPLPEDTETSPNFIVVQPGGILRVVLVLDTSGSMDGERFEKMIKGAKNFISSIVPDNSYVGIVEFNFKSEVDSNMTKLTNATSRNEMNSRLPTFANGATCIGCGILGGIEVAQYNGMDSRGTYLILLSDGEENEEPLIADTLDDIKNSSVIIHTIAFFEADTQMEELAQMTGGSSYTCPDGGSAQCVISAFVSIIATRPQSIPEAPRQVESKTVKVDPGSIETTTIMIDASLGLDTIMTFTWSANSIITISVTGPDGTSIESNDPEYNIDISSKIITISIDVAEPGKWIIFIINMHNLVEEVSVDVNSKQRSKDVYPPVVSSFLGAKIVNYTSFPVVEVYAYVHSNYQPVIDATVIATVESTSTGNETVIPLQDNGMGADLITGDGIYSAYFLDFSSNGRYGVKVDVNGITTSSSNNTLLRSKRAAGTLTTPRPPQGFQLTTTAGVFQVENYSPDLNVDILAPAKITDFTSVERTYDENRNVTLTWMAVGDDLDQGTAASYELRFSDNFTEIRTNFTSAPAITDTDLIVGNLSQVASSGNLESIAFILPGEDSDAIFYFMIRAWDEAGNVGPLSNIVSVSRRRLPPTTLPTTDLTSVAASNSPSSASNSPSSTGMLTSKLISTQSPGNPEEPFPLWAIITFSLLGIILLITIPIIIRVVCCRPKSKRVTGPHNDHMNPMYDGP